MIIIDGPNRLYGEIRVHGAKNSTLPLLAASVLCREPVVLHDCPELSDVSAAVRILEDLGAECVREGKTLAVDCSQMTGCRIPDSLMREMRSSIVFLGAMVSRMGEARLSFPGGCEIGARPIDLHLSALRKLGVEIRESHGELECLAPGGIKGGTITLSFPSVGATENIMLAAAVSKGRTVIHNAAREPEICDLAEFINCCGGRIYGAGESCIVIEGVSRLGGCEYRVMPDRIVAATYMSAAAMTGGRVLLRNSPNGFLVPLLSVFEECGCIVKADGTDLFIDAPARLKSPGIIRTMPYPGFPTDAQAPAMAMTTLAEGTCVFVENIFESRYKHAAELSRLGADIKVEGRVAVVQGVSSLSGASVAAQDLRGGAALVCAGLAAQGRTTVSGEEFICRGYEKITESFAELGAKITKV